MLCLPGVSSGISAWEGLGQQCGWLDGEWAGGHLKAAFAQQAHCS